MATNKKLSDYVASLGEVLKSMGQTFPEITALIEFMEYSESLLVYIKEKPVVTKLIKNVDFKKKFIDTGLIKLTTKSDIRQDRNFFIINAPLKKKADNEKRMKQGLKDNINKIKKELKENYGIVAGCQVEFTSSSWYQGDVYYLKHHVRTVKEIQFPNWSRTKGIYDVLLVYEGNDHSTFFSQRLYDPLNYKLRHEVCMNRFDGEVEVGMTFVFKDNPKESFQIHKKVLELDKPTLYYYKNQTDKEIEIHENELELLWFYIKN